ncbi:MAG TPA: FHA domain-containing protein [Dictyobacter sp.]|nr:FHA domain-containing protein [Dictyobacter sp.]
MKGSGFTSATQIPTWINIGSYGGLVCSASAIVIAVLYTIVRRYGTTRQLVRTSICFFISALFFVPAIVWFHVRFSASHAPSPTLLDVYGLAYIILCGWVLPLGILLWHCLTALPRNKPHLPGTQNLKERSVAPETLQQIPRYQSGVLAPFAFGEDTPWGWLEYLNGNFQGQRLALKRVVVSIGRDEDCDIWLDDDMVSRHHAELAWDRECVYLTDCTSLNGTKLDQKPISGSILIQPGDHITIGDAQFSFYPDERAQAPAELDDPLARHTWRSTQDLLTGSQVIPTVAADDGLPFTEHDMSRQPVANTEGQLVPDYLPGGYLVIREGAAMGARIPLDQPVVKVGRAVECRVVIDDASLAPIHAQFLRQADGDYVQDLSGMDATQVNEQSAQMPHKLKPGDVISLGNIQLAYMLNQVMPSVSLTTSGFLKSMSGPVPLRLPSRPKAKEI